MNKKTVISASDNTIRKLKILAKKKEGVSGNMVITTKKLPLKAKQLAVKVRENNLYKNKKTIISASDNTILKLKVSPDKKEILRNKLVVTAKKLATTARRKEVVRGRLAITAKKLAKTARRKEVVRSKLAITAKKLATTAQKKETTRNKLAVTARKLAQVAKKNKEIRLELLVSEARYRNLFETSKDGILLIDPQTEKITDANPHLLMVLGYSLGEIVGKSFWEIGTFRDIEAAKALFKELQSKGSVRYEDLPLLTRDGVEIEVEFVSSLYVSGKVKMIQCNIRDITKRRAVENEIDIVSKDLEAFSYSVSHDLRAPLRAIEGFSKILVEEYAPKIDDEGKRIISTIRESVDHMGKLIEDLLVIAHAGSQPITTQKIEMDELAKATFEELKKFTPSREITLNIEKLPPAYADPVLTKQIWTNLFSNAIKFTKSKNEAIIDVRSKILKGETVYSVKDNGVGFDMKSADKLFGVFQRLHSPQEFEGTGIGLAIIKRIVERHGGRAWAESKVGEGATFYFTLPSRLEVKVQVA